MPRRRRQRPKPTITQIWIEAAAVASGAPLPPREPVHDEDDSCGDLPKMQSYRAQTATIAPLLLGMSGLGGAAALVVRRSKRRMSDFSDIAHLAVSVDGIQLTHRQQELLRLAYSEANKKVVSTQSSSGVWICQRMMEDCAEVATALGLTDTKKKTSECLRTHCRLMTDICDMAIDSLDSLDNCLGPLLVSYGSAHARLHKDQSFRTEYYDVLSDAMCDFGLSWKLRTHRIETIQAWRLLVFFVQTKLKQGHELELSSC